MPAHLIAEDGPMQGLILNLEDGEEWIVGRGNESADFLLDDSTVSPKHARIYREDDEIFIENLTHVNPVLINHQEYIEPISLNEGDHVQIGITTFLFSKQDLPKSESHEEEAGTTADYNHVFEELDSPAEESQTSVPEEEPSYDTIFEEDSDEDPLLFNIPLDTPFMLKVISGPNAGAEIGIEKDHIYTIGKDELSSDILFQDLSVSKTHARLEVDSEGMISIEDLGSKNGTALNGHLIEGKQPISAHDLVGIGTTTFMIIDREAPQETIYSPIGQIIDEKEEIEETTEEEPAPSPITKRDWKKEPIPYKHLVIGGSALLIFLIAFFSFFSLFKSHDVSTTHKESISYIQDILDNSKYEDVHFTFNEASGQLFLVGHVLTPVNHQELRFAIDQLRFITKVEDTVVIDDGVTKMMNDLLSMNPEWKGVSVQAEAPGKFVATGYLLKSAEMSTLSEFFRVNFPYLDRLEYRIGIDETLRIQIQSMLLSEGFGGLTFDLTQGNVVLSGMYDHRKVDAFEDVVEKIKHLTAITSVKDFAIATSAKLAAIDLSSKFDVTGISMHDGKGYSAVLNGKIYTVDESVDGLKIIEIEEDMILLEKDGIRYKIDYTR